MTKEEVLELVLSEQYYTVKDLRYNQQVGQMMSSKQVNDFLMLKDHLVEEGAEHFYRLPLKTFNSKYCYFVEGKYLESIQKEYISILQEDYQMNQSTLVARNARDIVISRLYSEIEGTLRIENVPTTRKRIKEIHEGVNIVDRNDIIIQNMIKAMEYILNELPEFNKDNLLKIYHMLSDQCLDEEDKLKDGMYYRDDGVMVGGFDGAEAGAIDECMDSLFEFANNKDNIKKYDFLLPYICHYYLLYIHPYFDYNGRTARMISFWLCCINKINYAPYYLSEAINEDKQAYYNAIVQSRITNNDLTYFLGYILDTAIKYSFVYKNVENIKNDLIKAGESLTAAEYTYLKKVIAHNPSDYFNYRMFLEYISAGMTKQGALKILNQLAKYEILEKSKNKKNETIYRLNQKMITYRYNK